MATETWYIRELTVATGVNRLVFDRSSEANVAEAALTVPMGWVVGKTAALNYADMSNGAEVAAGSFSTTVAPNATAPAAGRTDNPAVFSPPSIYTTAVAISTLYPYNGYFPAGTWTFNFGFRAVTAANGQDGRVGIRVYKNAANFASITQLTSAILVGTTVTNLATNATQFSVVTWSTAPIIQLNNEYLTVKIAWEITGAGATSNNNDVNFRKGNTCNMISPEFRGREYTIT